MFRDTEEELERLNRELLEEEEDEEEIVPEDEEEAYEEYEDEDEDEDEDADPAPSQNPRTLMAIVLLVTAGVLLFLAYLLAKREGLI